MITFDPSARPGPPHHRQRHCSSARVEGQPVTSRPVPLALLEVHLPATPCPQTVALVPPPSPPPPPPSTLVTTHVRQRGPCDGGRLTHRRPPFGRRLAVCAVVPPPPLQLPASHHYRIHSSPSRSTADCAPAALRSSAVRSPRISRSSSAASSAAELLAAP